MQPVELTPPLRPTRTPTQTTHRTSPTTTTTTTTATSAMLLWPLISGLLFSSAQYSGPTASLVAAPGYCDVARLVRCQREATDGMHLAELSAASAQYSIGAGPPYSPAAKLREQQQREQLAGQAASSQAACRRVRASLDCVLDATPACYESGLQAARDTDLILRAKRFLEHSGCNQPDASWQVALCYRAPEVRQCEERFVAHVSALGAQVNTSTCLAYQSFRHCVDAHAKFSCKVSESDMANEYLIDRAGELAWRCAHANSTAAPGLQHYSAAYGLSNGPGGGQLAPLGSAYAGSTYAGYARDNYEQRPIPSYAGGPAAGAPLRAAEQSWERLRNPYDDSARPLAGEVSDRLVAGLSPFEVDSTTSDCTVKARPFALRCEDTLLEQRRRATDDAREANSLHHRLCCALFQYKDCVSRAVLDRCVDSSPSAVELIMGQRRRELVIMCRGINRDFCSGALALGSSPLLIVAGLLVGAFMALKQQRQLAPA